MKSTIKARNQIKNNYLKSAYQEALKAADKDEVPVGAVIVYEDKIIARGHNLKESKNSVLAHAELIALKKASNKLNSWRLSECDVYITLEPCAMCRSALEQARVRTVYYGATDIKGKSPQPTLKMMNLDEKECGQILSNFFKKKR